MKKPERIPVLDNLSRNFSRFTVQGDAYLQGYNKAIGEYERYHEQEMNKLRKSLQGNYGGGNCGGGWRYDVMRNCFVNQMGDIRG